MEIIYLFFPSTLTKRYEGDLEKVEAERLRSGRGEEGRVRHWSHRKWEVSSVLKAGTRMSGKE